MSIRAEVSEYFENLIKSLVTNQPLEELLWKSKDGNISKFEQNLKVQELESKNNTQGNGFKNLSDDNKQCSRHSCLRLHGIEF